uniref:Taste receptor type 2 n=1 Tax=Meleagris gallopavo TaxID=9103 RepID=A0A803YKB5_MELGA
MAGSMMGLLGNGTILAVSATSCFRSKILSSYEVTVIFLGLSRFLFAVLDDLQFFVFLNSSSFWFAAWLSVVYCIKVASFTQSFLICLKQRISSLTPWMLTASSLFSFATSLPFSWDNCNAHSNFTTPFTMTDSSERIATRKNKILVLILLCNVAIALPSIMFVFSSVLLIRSLWRHTRQMQNNATGFRDPILRAVIGAIKTVFSFLLLYITNLIALLLILSDAFASLSTEEAVYNCLWNIDTVFVVFFSNHHCFSEQKKTRWFMFRLTNQIVVILIEQICLSTSMLKFNVGI